MQIKNVNFVKCFKKVFSHLTMRNAVNKRVIGDHCHNAVFISLNKVFSKTKELNIVVIEINLFLTEVLFIGFNKLLYPLALIRRANAIGRVTKHNHNGLLVFYFISPFCFFSNGGTKIKSKQ